MKRLCLVFAGLAAVSGIVWTAFGLGSLLRHSTEDKTAARVRMAADLAKDPGVQEGRPEELLGVLRTWRPPEPEKRLEYILADGYPVYVKCEGRDTDRICWSGALAKPWYRPKRSWADVSVAMLRGAPWLMRNDEWVRVISEGAR